MPFKFVRTVLADLGDAAHFIDKPWIFVEGSGGTCTLQVPLEDGTTVAQTVPASTIHMMYSVFLGPEPDQHGGDHGDGDHRDRVDHHADRKHDDVGRRVARAASVQHGDGEDDDDTTAGGGGPRTNVMYTRSTDCGATFSKPIKVSKGMRIGNGASIAKPMVSGARRVYGAWRRFLTPDGTQGDAIVSVVSNDDEGRALVVEFRAAAMGRSTTYRLQYDYQGAPNRLGWELISGDLERELDGHYELTAGADGTTEVVYELAVDLIVPIPGFVKRRAEGKIIGTALDELKKRVEG